MKKTFLSFTVVLFMSLFTTNIFAQDVPGGESDGSGGTPPPDDPGNSVTVQPAAVHFTRNNGDGTCGDKAQIRFYYTTAPTSQPLLTQIYYDGQPLFANFTPVAGNITDFASKGYVSFCLNVSNIPPAIKLTLTYDASSTQKGLEITGTD